MIHTDTQSDTEVMQDDTSESVPLHCVLDTILHILSKSAM